MTRPEKKESNSESSKLVDPIALVGKNYVDDAKVRERARKKKWCFVAGSSRLKKREIQNEYEREVEYAGRAQQCTRSEAYWFGRKCRDCKKAGKCI